MSHWDSEAQKIIRWPSERAPEHPNWLGVDCGCCCGIEWGGEQPVECNQCKGSGWLWLHEPSKRLALYPGGPFAGRVVEHLEGGDDG